MTLCDPITLARANNFDCLPLDQKERLAFDMLRWLANEVQLTEIDVESEAPCIWNRFSEKQKWSVILYALCQLALENGRATSCPTCRSALPGDFLALNADDRMRAWLSLLTAFVTFYDEGGEFDAFRETYDQPCRDSVWRLNVMLNIALQFLEALAEDTDPDVLMCSDNNPYWNVHLGDVPAWLFQLICDLYLLLTTPQ